MDYGVVQSTTTEQYAEDLKKVLQTLNKFQMKLNAEKCAFDIASGKFQGFLVTQRGIDVNLEKIEVINSMLSPNYSKRSTNIDWLDNGP